MTIFQRSLARLATLASLVLVVGGAVHAAPVNPALFQDLHWRSIGPFRGGRVLAVTGVPSLPNRFYFGAVNGGVWRTDDAGRTWAPIFDDQPVGSIGAIAVAPSAPETLYVGAGEADMRSDIAQGEGVFKSVDGGAHWAAIGLADTRAIGRILVDPRDPDTVLVAALGHSYGPNAERGVFRTSDGGRSWTKTLFKNADTGAIDLAFQPDNPDVVYAALWQTRRPPWNVYPPSSGPGGGIYKSLDGGRTWTQLVGRGLPAAVGRVGLATSPAAPRRVYALIDAAAFTATEGGLYRSDDAGASWRKVSGDKRIWNRGWYFGGITVDPKDADRVWVCDTILLRSQDGGATFLPLKGDPTGDDFHALWVDPANPDHRILGVDQGTLVTLNGGATWSSWYNQPTGQFYHVATDNRFPYRVYGAQQDSGAASVPSRSDSAFDGITLQQFREEAAGGESDEIAPDPNDPDTVYGGRVDKLDLRSGQTRSVDPTLAFPDNYRGTWTLPLTFSADGRDLFFGNQRIFKTSDGGQRWTPISPDLTRPAPEVPANVDASTSADAAEAGPRRGVVYDIAPSKVAAGLIWAGTDDGLVWKTVDGGAHWRNVTPPALTPWSKIGTVEASRFDPAEAWLAVDRHRLDDFAPYVYRTRDGGGHWAPIVDGLADGDALDTVNVVREDPARRGLLYAGTERGVFVSFDDGDHWQPLQTGLPRTSVRDITIHGDDLLIATHGRGFYVLDDIAPLRALAADASETTRLLPAAPAIRVNEPRFTGTPMPKDEPLAVNPPEGAYIDYVIAPGKPAPTVEITIFDASGAVANRFNSADPVKAPDLAEIESMPEWLPKAHPPGAAPGANRFVWNEHYAPPSMLGGAYGTSGAWAPPGRYEIELSVDGKAYRGALEVRPDPRVKASPANFAAEFALARQIEAARVEARTAILAARKQRQALEKTPGSEAQLRQLDAIVDFRPTESENKVVAKARSASGLSEVSERLDALARAVDGADGAPNADAISGFALAKKTLEADLSQLRALPPPQAAQ